MIPSAAESRGRAAGTVSRPGKGGTLTLPVLPIRLALPDMPGALCKGEDPSVWFPFPGTVGRPSASVRRAKAVCAACPARARCLEWALKANEIEGVWGGMTPAERARIRRQSRGGGG